MEFRLQQCHREPGDTSDDAFQVVDGGFAEVTYWTDGTRRNAGQVALPWSFSVVATVSSPVGVRAVNAASPCMGAEIWVEGKIVARGYSWSVHDGTPQVLQATPAELKGMLGGG